jgi:metal-responsive CopG/Arc/MetJ family transcriptional regulator
MKIKTSVTLSRDVLEMIDAAIGESGNRSEFIEQAIENYIKQKLREQREGEDLEILNRCADQLNRESRDVLSYQVDL